MSEPTLDEKVAAVSCAITQASDADGGAYRDALRAVLSTLEGLRPAGVLPRSSLDPPMPPSAGSPLGRRGRRATRRIASPAAARCRMVSIGTW